MMRTTITLDPDVQTMITALMKKRGVSFTVAVNEALRRGLQPRRNSGGFTQRTHRMGAYAAGLPHATQVADDLEDDALLRRLDGGGGHRHTS